MQNARGCIQVQLLLMNFTSTPLDSCKSNVDAMFRLTKKCFCCFDVEDGNHMTVPKKTNNAHLLLKNLKDWLHINGDTNTAIGCMQLCNTKCKPNKKFHAHI